MRLTHLAALIVVLLAVQALGAQQQPGSLLPGKTSTRQKQERFSVSARFKSDTAPAGGSIRITADYECAPEHYIYADTVELSLAGVKPEQEGFSIGETDRPEPTTKYDRFRDKETNIFNDDFTVTAPLQVDREVPEGSYTVTLEAGYRGCGPDRCYLPATETFELKLRVAGQTTPPAKQRTAGEQQPGKPEPTGEGAPAEPEGQTSEFADKGLLTIIVLAFLGGLGLFFTPCVYPMVPVTIGIVGATSGQSRLDGLVKSLFYVLGISITYAALGLLAATAGGMFGAWAQNPVFYLVLAALFVALAGAMFDLYIIQVPGSWASRWQNRLKGRAGLIGILALGLLSGVVVSPCIAPVVAGAMAYVSQTGDHLLGFLIFFSLAWGMGTPLVILGTFSGLLKSLPESGAWLQTVKHAMGLLLVAAAVYFVGKSGIVPEYWFHVGTAALAVVISVFIGAFDTLSADSGWAQRAQKAVGLLVLGGGVTLFAGTVLPENLSVGGGAGGTTSEASIDWYHSEEKAVAEAEEQNKPMMIDFRADWCPPCIQMEQTTFRNPRVVEASRRFINLKIDVEGLSDTRRQELREDYGLVGVPHLVFLNSQGKMLPELTRQEYVSADELLTVLEQIE